MSELLAPAGNIDAFYASISNGCDALYVGLNQFSARAYAKNFDFETLKSLTEYAHLREVKVYVTMNTIIYEHELDNAYKCIDYLAKINVDAVIVQDLALLYYITNKYPQLEAHISTQVGIDSLDGVKAMEELNAKRCVLSREVPLTDIINIKKFSKMPLEVFIHGALCVSYSGNCFMSGLLGMRSGNRGRCVGCCRKLYALKDITNNITYNKCYLLSMKDLNVSRDISKLSFIDSFKIEGRMKDASYVASIVKYYRDIIDKGIYNEENIMKSFQRTYTKGYILENNPKEITNILKPNNNGYLIGKVVNVSKKGVLIKLDKEVNQFDQIRIETKDLENEVSIPLVKMYDKNFNLINHSNTYIFINIKENVSVNDLVYKTKDYKYQESIVKTYKQEYRRFPIKFIVKGKINDKLSLTLKYKDLSFTVYSENYIEVCKTRGIDYNNFLNLLSKLNDTPYYLEDLSVDFPSNGFIYLKEISTLRRDLIELLNNKRLERKYIENKVLNIDVPKFNKIKPKLTFSVSTKEQYDYIKSMGFEDIYFDNFIPRNNALYKEIKGDVLVGGFGGLYHYKNTNNVICDYSFNVVNALTTAILFKNGAKRVTLSYELNKDNINDLVNNYYNTYNTYPNLELIVYGRQNLMVSKYCPLKRLDLCGMCKSNKYQLIDDYASFPITFNSDCTINLLNSKYLNLIDELDSINGINYYRLVFTTESLDEVKRIVNLYIDKLNNKLSDNYFNKDTDTRGYFNKEIM